MTESETGAGISGRASRQRQRSARARNRLGTGITVSYGEDARSWPARPCLGVAPLSLVRTQGLCLFLKAETGTETETEAETDDRNREGARVGGTPPGRSCASGR